MPESVQVPPQALEAEMAVLGSMLIEKDAVERAVELLDEGHFYRDAHRKIFRAIANLHEAGQAVDLVTVGEELRRLDWLGEVGGPSYLTEVIHSVSTAAHVDHYAHLVRDKAVLRELIAAATRIVTDAYAEEKEPAALLDEAQARIMSVAQKQALPGFSRAKDLAHEAVEDIERFHKRKEAVTGIPTGLTRVDRLTAGLQKGDLILIAARPSQGKTALALNIAAHVVLDRKNPRPVAFFSLEMTSKAIMMRLIASEAGVNLHDLRTGFFETKYWPQITEAAHKVSESGLFINDSTTPSVLAMRSSTKRLAGDLKKEGKELGLVIIDYLQLMHGSSRRVESRQQEVSDISRGLKFLARDLNIPVIALSQLNRRTEEKGRPDGKPQLSDLRESGALEQDADLVAFIYREGYYKPNDPTLENKAEIIVAKQRNGPTGSIEVSFNRKTTRFGNAAPEGEEAPATVEASEEESAFL